MTLKNENSSIKDNILLLIIIVLCIAIGVVLIIFRPEFWIVNEVHTVVFGTLLILAGVMWIPGFIYQVIKNDNK